METKKERAHTTSFVLGLQRNCVALPRSPLSTISACKLGSQEASYQFDRTMVPPYMTLQGQSLEGGAELGEGMSYQ
jgi:hypothetical protein